MGSSAYEKHYLFRDSEDCCNRFFPTVSDCPYEDHTTATQTGYYWETYHDDISNLEDMPVQYNHTYYPDINANTCVNGTDYPSWMASDVDYKRLYLFKTIKGCCNHWFQAYGDGCEKAVIQGVYEFMEPCPTNRPDCNNNSTAPANVTAYNLGKWYPDTGSHTCRNDGKTPSWMLRGSYVEWYLFNTREQCCAAFGFCWIRERYVIVHIHLLEEELWLYRYRVKL